MEGGRDQTVLLCRIENNSLNKSLLIKIALLIYFNPTNNKGLY